MLQHQAKPADRQHRFLHLTTWCVVLGLLLPALSGCFGAKQRKGGAGRAAGSAIEPDDVTGRWKMSIANHGAQTDLGLLDISYDSKQAENKYSIRLIGLPAEAPPVKATSLKISDDGKVDFEIDMTNNMISTFSGRLDGEAIWGSFLMPHFQLAPAKLERSDLEKVEQKEPTPVSHFEDFMKAQNANDSYVSMDALAETANRSPLMFEIYENLAGHFKKEKFTREQVDAFIEKYRKAVEVWGPRLAPLVDLNVANALAKQELFPDLAQSLLDAADSKLTDEYPLEYKAKLVEVWIVLGNTEKAMKRLPKLQEEDPANPFLLWLYGRAKEKAKETDAAMLAFTKVAVLPGYEEQLRTPTVELPSQSAVRLWKSTHSGSTNGFDQYAQQAYAEVRKAFVPQRTPAKIDPKATVSLIEMFTSCHCDPCIGPEVALDALRSSYSNQEVVILRYFEHNPFIDALGNESSARRMSYYNLSETPSMTFNGHIVDRPLSITVATGFGQILSGLRATVELESKNTTPLSIRLSAERKGDEIQVKADVSGVQSLEHQPRLYLALVENEIFFPGKNRILIHDCVVRGFAGGVKGLTLPKGESSHLETISVKDLKQELTAHLTQFEDATRKLPLKPMDLKKLQVVAFIQPNFTKVVLQSAIADVTGDVPPEAKDAPVEAKPEDKAKAKPDEKPEAKPEVKPEEKAKPEEKPEAKPEEKAETKPEEKPKTEEPAATEKPVPKEDAAASAPEAEKKKE